MANKVWGSMMKNGRFIFENFRVFIVGVLLCLPISSVIAGDFTMEIGESLGPIPKGEYIDDLDKIEQLGETTLALKAPRIAVKYTFDWGLTLGRETFGSSSFAMVDREDHPIEEDEYYLIVQLRGYSVGWSFGESLRFGIEAGIPEKALVSATKRLVDTIENQSLKSQTIDATWLGISLDWGFLESDGNGIGIVISFRQVDLKTDDFFSTGKSFDAGGTYFTGGIRYRF